ncbi:MAG TPA: hexose kinase [Clostridia bacterium]|nr:hexose kinase [Clostridia bacterium]
MILCIGTTPAAQRVMRFRKLNLDEVNRAMETLDGAAGKSINVAKVLQTLGANPIATGFLGGDRGEELRQLLTARGINLEFVTVSARTRQCITVVDESAGTITELVQESQPVSAADYMQLEEIVRRRLPGCQAVVMSGTIAPGVPSDFYFRTTELAQQSGVMPIVDAQGTALIEALRAKPALVKPNRKELAATVGQELDSDSAVLSAMKQLQQHGAERVVVTAGQHPTLAFDGRQSWRIQSPRIKAVNPIGSGDSFTAALVWRLVQGDDLGEACRWGAAAGAANALSIMPGDLNRANVERLAAEMNVEKI